MKMWSFCNGTGFPTAYASRHPVYEAQITRIRNKKTADVNITYFKNEGTNCTVHGEGDGWLLSFVQVREKWKRRLSTTALKNENSGSVVFPSALIIATSEILCYLVYYYSLPKRSCVSRQAFSRCLWKCSPHVWTSTSWNKPCTVSFSG